MWHYQKLFDFCCLLDVKNIHSISLVSSINSSDILSLLMLQRWQSIYYIIYVLLCVPIHDIMSDRLSNSGLP